MGLRPPIGCQAENGIRPPGVAAAAPRNFAVLPRNCHLVSETGEQHRRERRQLGKPNRRKKADPKPRRRPQSHQALQRRDFFHHRRNGRLDSGKRLPEHPGNDRHYPRWENAEHHRAGSRARRARQVISMDRGRGNSLRTTRTVAHAGRGKSRPYGLRLRT